MESMFTRMTSSIISDVMCAQSCVGGENAAAPLTTVSMRPYFASASFLSCTQVPRCATSATTAMLSPPLALISALNCSTCGSISTMTTFAPS